MDHGAEKLDEFRNYYPSLISEFYNPKMPETVGKLVESADLVIVHEWTSPEVVEALGMAKAKHDFILLFHDTHHRVVSDPEGMSCYDFSHFDGALVFGEVLRKIYETKGWIPKVWTWHEAADVSLFKPRRDQKKKGDLVWIGNWGDDEREEELMEYLILPVAKLGIKARIYGVRYPDHALKALKNAGIEYGGWLPNYKVPEVFAQYRLTLHIPRRPYVELLPGIPTIRPFEAMACGMPLICSPWKDSEDLFTKGTDYLQVSSDKEMKEEIEHVLNDPLLSESLSSHGNDVIQNYHTCGHRVDQLEDILVEMGVSQSLIHLNA